MLKGANYVQYRQDYTYQKLVQTSGAYTENNHTQRGYSCIHPTTPFDPPKQRRKPS